MAPSAESPGQAVFDAVILAGGEARRLGGADKPGLTVGGRPLVEHVVTAVADARTTIVVGPERPIPAVVFVREDPPRSGPVPALAAGLNGVTAPWVVLLAGDLPFITASHVTSLLNAATTRPSSTSPAHVPDDVEGAAPEEGPVGGVVMVDDGGREQWLAGVWPAARLKRALAAYSGRSLKGLLGPLTAVRLSLPGRPWFDCDTMDDLEEARMHVLNEWTALACKELGIDPADVDRDLILDLTKEVAHGVARPAAPLTAYLLGLAQGAGTAPDDAVAKLITLAKNWGQATTETLTDS
ncbi:NTP transferase domain-containing protein [Nonomuraea angiospora]|uniref:NTP transferase domain-containing protein n=1 Tax=Nonomuraea angiospora TaxID=46172 RepID=UPI0029AED885|nr:NTP transferase domain-containing protein [Nonomuraea angiospora]MDX3110490.1 NTP transferase domain-containing protein [Nonomuraea angiospora]